MSAIDRHAVRELELHMDNTYALYQRLQAVRVNQAKHLNRGNWNLKDSIKGFRHAVDAGAKSYVAEYGGSFSVATRNETARNYAIEFAHENGIPTKNLVG